MLVAMLSKGQITFYEDTTITLEPHIPPGSEMPHTTTTTLDSNEVKLVYWVHGLSGGYESWSPVQKATQNQFIYPIINYPERLTEGLSVDYSGKENTTVLNIATELIENTIETWLTPISGRDTFNHDHSFIISHSQGGIVARSMRYVHLSDPSTYSSYFGGIATFGTPHGGAQIINSSHKTTGAALPWIIEGCTRFIEAEVQNVLNEKWLIDALIPSSTLQNFAGQACDGFIGKMVLPVLINSIRKDAAADYAVGNPLLDTLAAVAAQDTLPVVVFYGVEQEPVLWRLLHTMTYTTDTSLSGSIIKNDPFGLNDDDELPAEINAKIYDYKGQEAFYRNRAKDFNIAAAACILCGPAHIVLGQIAKSANRKADVYKNAHLWLGNANLVWKRLIGARVDTVYTNGYECYCNDQLLPNLVPTPAQCVDVNGNSNKCYTIPSIVQHTIEKQNDGVVPVWSQIAYPNAIIAPVMTNTNHMQERNCDKTKDALNLLFSGQLNAQFHLNEK
jgi:hypothetical protein